MKGESDIDPSQRRGVEQTNSLPLQGLRYSAKGDVTRYLGPFDLCPRGWVIQSRRSDEINGRYSVIVWRVGGDDDESRENGFLCQ